MHLIKVLIVDILYILYFKTFRLHRITNSNMLTNNMSKLFKFLYKYAYVIECMYLLLIICSVGRGIKILRIKLYNL